jgi:uncharacterized protein YlxP (DUF503 family)
MLVCVALLELRIEFAESLKDKRMVVRSLKDKLRTRFEMSVAEVAMHDVHTVARLGMTFIALDDAAAESKLGKIQEFVESNTDAVVTGWTSEKLDFDDALAFGEV